MHGCIFCAECDFNRGNTAAQREREAISGSSCTCSHRNRCWTVPLCLHAQWGQGSSEEQLQGRGRLRHQCREGLGSSLIRKAKLHPWAEASTFPYAQDQANCFIQTSVSDICVPHTLSSTWVCPAFQSQYLDTVWSLKYSSFVSWEAQAAPCCPSLWREAEAEAEPPSLPLVAMADSRHLALTETRLWALCRGQNG